MSVEESASIFAKWCLSVGLFTFGHDSIGSVLAMYLQTIGQVSVRYMYQWCISRQSALLEHFFITFVPKSFSFVTRYLQNDTWWTFFVTNIG